MKILVCSLMILFSLSAVAQKKYKKEIKQYQKELNRKFRSEEESPLSKESREEFKKHEFYPVNKKYRLKARFEKIKDTQTVKLKTTTERLPAYDRYGKLHFSIEGRNFTLTLYQNHRLREMEEYKDHLFLPFTDKTNGKETYGGGRYIDFSVPDSNTVILDFNKSYNPYCAYDHRYSCPVPPQENNLDIRIEAGIKDYGKAGH